MPFHRPTVPPKFISRQVAEARRFYLNLRPAATEGITVICGGWERSAADYRIQRASFPFLSVEYVAGGLGEVTLGEQTHVLGPGAFYAYGPDVPHTISTDPEKRLSKYFVNYMGTRARTPTMPVKMANRQAINGYTDATKRSRALSKALSFNRIAASPYFAPQLSCCTNPNPRVPRMNWISNPFIKHWAKSGSNGSTPRCKPVIQIIPGPHNSPQRFMPHKRYILRRKRAGNLRRICR